MKTIVRMCMSEGLGMGVLALAGCAGPIQVKDMVQDPDAYSAQYFSLDDNIPLDLKKFLRAPGKEHMGFKTLTVEGTVENPHATQPTVPVTFTLVEHNDNNDGLVRLIETTKSNDVPASVHYRLSYRGFFPIRAQSGSMTSRIAPRINYLRDVTAWPRGLAKVEPDTTYSYKYAIGWAGQIANFQPGAMECKTDKFYPASQFLATVPGRAIDMQCDLINANGVASGHTKATMLARYGVVLLTESASATSTSIFHTNKITVE